MAKGRFVSASVATDARLNGLSTEAELAYLMAIPHLDRDGLIEGNPDVLWGKTCVKRRAFLDTMPQYIEEWVKAELVTQYDTDNGPVLWFRGFRKNQVGLRYDREIPSRFAPPPGYIRDNDGLVPAESSPPVRQEYGENPDEFRESAATLRQPSGNHPAQWQVEVKDQEQPEEEDEDARARDPIHAAWFETFAAEMPAEIERAIGTDLDGCSDEAVIHAIRASVNAKERTFKYLKTCALNYIPPAPAAATHRNPYTAEVPGVHRLEPPAQPPPVAASLPAPLAYDDPWAVCLAELKPTLPMLAQSYLEGSTCEVAGDVDGVPLYRVMVDARAADGVQWLTKQVGTALRRGLGSVLRKPVLIEIEARAAIQHAHEIAPPPTMHMQTEVQA